MTKWADNNQVLSPQHKWFCPTEFEPRFEHQFVLDEDVAAAKMQSKSFAVTWLDVKTAFGSIETVSMLQIFNFFPQYIIKNIYEGGEFMLQGGVYTCPVTKSVRHSKGVHYQKPSSTWYWSHSWGVWWNHVKMDSDRPGPTTRGCKFWHMPTSA